MVIRLQMKYPPDTLVWVCWRGKKVIDGELGSASQLADINPFFFCFFSRFKVRLRTNGCFCAPGLPLQWIDFAMLVNISIIPEQHHAVLHHQEISTMCFFGTVLHSVRKQWPQLWTAMFAADACGNTPSPASVVFKVGQLHLPRTLTLTAWPDANYLKSHGKNYSRQLKPPPPTHTSRLGLQQKPTFCNAKCEGRPKCAEESTVSKRIVDYSYVRNGQFLIQI